MKPILKAIVRFSILLCLALVLADCNPKHSRSGTITVPQISRIPHYSDSHVSITKKLDFNKMPDKPPALDHLYHYLQQPDKFTGEKLKLISNVSQVLSIGNSHLLILDTFANNLSELDLKTDSTWEVARYGRGPGDLLFAEEMAKKGTMVYVAQQMQISRFDCSIFPCKYSGTTELKFMPYSLAFSGDSIAALGNIVGFNRNDADKIKKLPNLKAVHLINNEGKQVGVFGDAYNVGHDWMLLRPFVSSGFVRYSSSQKQFLVAYREFPIIYVYGNDLKLKQTFSISAFTLDKMKYSPHNGLSFGFHDHTVIRDLTIFGRNDVLIETVTLTNRHISNHQILNKRRHDFYVLDLKNHQNYYMGDMNLNESDPNIAVTATSDGLFIYKGDKAYWIGF